MRVIDCTMVVVDAKVLNTVGVLTIVNRGILEINQEGTKNSR